jgi:hypothetical protein
MRGGETVVALERGSDAWSGSHSEYKDVVALERGSGAWWRVCSCVGEGLRCVVESM